MCGAKLSAVIEENGHITQLKLKLFARLKHYNTFGCIIAINKAASASSELAQFLSQNSVLDRVHAHCSDGREHKKALRCLLHVYGHLSSCHTNLKLCNKTHEEVRKDNINS